MRTVALSAAVIILCARAALAQVPGPCATFAPNLSGLDFRTGFNQRIGAASPAVPIAPALVGALPGVAAVWSSSGSIVAAAAACPTSATTPVGVPTPGGAALAVPNTVISSFFANVNAWLSGGQAIHPLIVGAVVGHGATFNGAGVLVDSGSYPKLTAAPTGAPSPATGYQQIPGTTLSDLPTLRANASARVCGSAAVAPTFTGAGRPGDLVVFASDGSPADGGGPCAYPTAGPTPTGTNTPTPVATPTPIFTPSPSPSPGPTPSASPTYTVLTSTLNAVSGHTYDHYQISTTSGPCVVLNGVNGVTLSASKIGPCGGAAGSTTTSDANGVEVTGNSYDDDIYDNWIHTETFTGVGGASGLHDGILLNSSNGSSSIVAQGNVIAYGDRNIESNDNGGGGYTYSGNFLLQPNGDRLCGSACQSNGGYQGNFIDDGAHDTTITSNYGVACRPFGGSGPGNGEACSSIPGLVSSVLYDAYSCDGIILNDTREQGGAKTVTGNYDVGNGWVESATCMLFRSGSGTINASNNKGVECSVSPAGPFFVNTASGGFSNQQFFTNNSGPNGDQVAFSAGNWQNTGPYGTWTGADSNFDNIDSSGNHHGAYCGGPACSSVITLTGVVIGAGAFPTLGVGSTVAQVEAVIGAPPLIPPLPHSCVAASPFSTQTSKPGC